MTSIYARWLFEQNTRPASVTKEGLEQEFYQIIFHQFSLLFQPRIARNTSTPTTPAVSSVPLSSSGLGQSNSTSTANNNIRNNASFHINIPVSAHNHIVPLTFNSATPITGNNNASSSHNNSGNNLQTTALKETLSQLVQRHIELCKKALKVLAMAGRTLVLSTETWAVLLKVMLGVTDYLLKEPTGESSNLGVMNMADELCDSLLQVLFELWLKSTTMDVEMWDILKTCFTRWTHRSKAIQQWNSTSLALTKRIQNLMYGDRQGTDGVYVNGPNVKLDLPSEFVYYAWHRVIYLIPHPLQLPPSNFSLAMLGVGNLIDTLNATENIQPEINPTEYPDGNTILHMFSTYLFDAASQSANADQESQCGCAESLATLCKIFSKPQRRQPFLRTYVERFYAALTVGLKSESCLPTILLSCTELFATDLEGVRMLVPDFISAIRMVLPKMRFDCKTNVSIDNLRLAAIKVLSTIMCLPNHFDRVELKLGWDFEQNVSSENVSLVGEQEQLVTQLIRVLYAEPVEGDSDHPFLSLKFYILEVLLMSLRTETSSYNMRYILHLINVYVIEDVPFCPGLVGTVVKLIQDKILTMQLPADVTLVAFDVLMDFVDLYDFVKRDSKNVARELVLALSRYVDTLISQGKLVQTYPLIVQAYDCMMKWILVSQWIIDDCDCYKAVIATLSKGITIFDREPAVAATPAEPINVEKKKRRDTAFPPTKQLFQLPPRVNKHNNHHQADAVNNLVAPVPTPRTNSTVHKKEEMAVRMAAEYCMSQFVNQLGRFTLPNTDTLGNCRSATVDDVLQLKEFRHLQTQDSNLDSNSSIRYFLIDRKTLLAVIDVTDQTPTPGSPENVPSLIAVIRDTTGKYVWSMETRYKDSDLPPSLSSTPLDSPVSTLASKSGLLKVSSSSEYNDKNTEPGHSVLVPTAIAINEKEMPTIHNIFVPQSEEWKQWETVKVLSSREEESELSRMQVNGTNIKHSIPSTKPNIDSDSPRGFRLLLSQIGFLLPKNRKHITPLHITDSVISEMETLDMLNERDCVSISAYFTESGDVTWSELIENPPPLSDQFLQFINCVGWPVNTKSHKGYKGKLDSSICETLPYYSDRSVEFIVNVPYFLKSPPANNITWGNANTISKIHQQISSDDHVCVIWIEDLDNYKSIAKLIKNSSSANSKAMVFLFINPLKNSADGLYWVRILVPTQGTTPANIAASQRLNENALIFGPLVDGIVVSRHALGSMVRSTAISAHQACRVVTDTYTRPYVIRKEYIEEMAHRHRVKLPLSEFYSDIFTDSHA
ncbi:uncharacterized protein EV154DRAFT_364 [Mucor mucedo]|uniref:uncharacterized protein n=1 Tax=Mucor mucedo TaxID=29922 RepID=UPI00221F4F81|nr:uncharacterized protein EV154DRAFT_364 [Mucor mucedo]KAI7897175.1 hypothetical protein EV154DRAFT_364 [Mucor mucedo]